MKEDATKQDEQERTERQQFSNPDRFTWEEPEEIEPIPPESRPYK